MIGSILHVLPLHPEHAVHVHMPRSSSYPSVIYYWESCFCAPSEPLNPLFVCFRGAPLSSELSDHLVGAGVEIPCTVFMIQKLPAPLATKNAQLSSIGCLFYVPKGLCSVRQNWPSLSAYHKIIKRKNGK